MSQPRGFGLNGKSTYTNVTKPCDVSLQFIVDASDENGLGIRSLKSNGYVEDVFMHVNGNAPFAPTMDISRTYAVLGSSTVTNTGSTVVTGNLGLTPGTSVTGFPPGTISGTENVANAAAVAAKVEATSAYTDLSTRPAGTTESTLDGLTLPPGTYTSASTMDLATSGNATLTFDAGGNPNAVWIMQIGSTLTTGAGGIATMVLAGGAQASNIYWQVGSSATINVTSGSLFLGNIIASASITVGSGTARGSLIALSGAVTISAAAALTAQSPTPSFIAGANPNPAPGFVMIRLTNSFNHYLGQLTSFESPVDSTTATTATVAGQAYVISALGTATLAQWQARGLTPGFTPAVGQSFIASSSGTIGGSAEVSKALNAGSGVTSMEVVGNPDLSIANSSIAANGGAIVIGQFMSSAGVTPPADGSVVNMTLHFDGSSVTIDGL